MLQILINNPSQQNSSRTDTHTLIIVKKKKKIGDGELHILYDIIKAK